MAISIIIGVLVGAVFGWISCRLVYEQRNRKKQHGRDRVLREALQRGAKDDKFITELHAQFGDPECLRQTAEAELDLVVLAKLDSGDISEAKRGLIFKVAQFYHKWSTAQDRPVPTEVQQLLSAIKEAADSYESVKAAVSHRPEP
jgi:hypothetical protein